MLNNRKNDHAILPRKFLMRLTRVSIFVCLLISITILPDETKAAPSCDLAKSIFPALQKLRGLSFYGPVKCELHDKNQVLKFVSSEINKKEVSEKAKIVESVLQSLKVIPKGFDYQKQMIDLYTGQIGGYYDPKTKKYVMAAWMPDFVQPTVASHELTHALQDKYYDLQKFLDEKNYSTDQILARSALIEGDATMAMYDYVGAALGQPLLSQQPSVESYILQTVMGMYATGSSNTVPKLITATLIFPYTSGFRFAHHLARNGDGYKSVDSAFKNPPNSTREILFPDQYLSRIKNLNQDDPLKPRLDHFEQIVNSINVSNKTIDSLGSFFLSNWLSSQGATAQISNHFASILLSDKVLVTGKTFMDWKLLFDSDSETEIFKTDVCPLIQKNSLSCKLDIDENSQVSFIRIN